MIARAAVASLAIVLAAASLRAQTATAAKGPFPRAVRRDLPLQPGIRRAYARGTRDSVTGGPGPHYFQQRVDYRINATLDTAAAVLHGSETITLHNTTPDTLSNIVLRLYQNYFTAGESRNDYVTDITDGVVVERLVVNGTQIATTDKARYAVDGTVATVTPATPVLPGADATIEATWHFTVPTVDTTTRGERMGRFGHYLFQVAQWYPQVAMYDDMRGWDRDQYLGIGEFYNQFGAFDVNITVPGGWLVGATGDLQNPTAVLSQRTRDRLALAMRVDSTVHVVTKDERLSGTTPPEATLTWHFTAPNVNDFAFATSRDYVWDATHANIPGKQAIPVNLFYLPQHTAYARNNTVQYGRFALEHHSAYLFPYEFSQGTIADGPETGMEYPMIIFNGPGLEVTVHEFGHQWFPMTVSSDETRYGWQDEGFNEFIDAAAIADYQHKPNDPAAGGESYRRVAGSELEAPMMWPVDFVGPNATMTTYIKAPVALYALGGVVGDSAVHLAFRRYAEQWKFKHPSPWDFFASMNHALGQNLDWFWYQWWFTTHTVDQAIAGVSTKNGVAVVSVEDKGDMPMPLIARAEFSDGTSSTVTLPETGWFSGVRTATVRIPLKGKTLTRVTLDPENRFQDLDRVNNVWPTTGERNPPSFRR
jgi:hypothetical protein